MNQCTCRLIGGPNNDKRRCPAMIPDGLKVCDYCKKQHVGKPSYTNEN